MGCDHCDDVAVWVIEREHDDDQELCPDHFKIATVRISMNDIENCPFIKRIDDP